jgi:hypothetical protein
VFEQKYVLPNSVLKHSLQLSHLLPRAATVLLAASLFCAFVAGSAGAATYVVDTGADNGALTACTGSAGDCSLRGAIDTANLSASTPDAITFAGSVTSATLDAPIDPITDKLTINGAGTTEVVGSLAYATVCTPNKFAFDASTAQVALVRLAIHGVCGRAIKSNLAAPTIQIGPRRADNTVSINGTGGGANPDIFTADAPAVSGEALSFLASVVAPGGSYSFPLATLPALSDKFTAVATDSSGVTSPFAAPVSRPADLTSPTLINAVANANNSVRLDFNESIGAGVTPAAFTLTMGSANRQINSVDISGNSVFLGSPATPWSTGEAGTVGFTGASRVTDLTGNEVLGLPTSKIYAGPGELNVPVSSRFRANPTKLCQKKTSKCRRGQTYLYLTLNKASRVVFNVYRATGRKFVVRYVHKLPAGTSKMRLFGTINGRTLPATSLIVSAVAEDAARNFSVPVEAPFKVVTKKSQL